MLANEFIETFREEHRRMRDILLSLGDAFETSDHAAIREGVEEMAAHAAPHFLYEEQALYPALAGLYGDEYVDKLLDEHDLAVAAAQELMELAQKDEIDAEAAEYGAELVRRLLPHVSERDGISVIVEVLSPEEVGAIRDAQKKSKARGAKLSALAERAKKRKRTAAPQKSTTKAAKPKAKAARKPVRKIKVHKG